MDCPIQVVLGVVMRRSMYHLQEVVAMVVEVGTALPMAARLSGSLPPDDDAIVVSGGGVTPPR
jgi:hypothetical protein